MSIFYISGITGHVGGAATRQLLEEGHKVRALSRNPAKASEWTQKGVDVRQGDFNDAASIAKVLDGVDGAFLMLPPFFTVSPGWPEAEAMVASFSTALRQAPPPRLVVLSSIGSQQSHSLGLITATHLLEAALADLPFPTAFIRAGSFLENYIPSMEGAATTGWLDSYWMPTNRPLPMIATADIGKEVARRLVAGWGGKKIVELGSPFSPDDIAGVLSTVLGRSVQARPVPREQWNASMQGMDIPPRTAELYAEMVDGTNSGWIGFGVSGTEPVAGTLTPVQFFEQARKTKTLSER